MWKSVADKLTSQQREALPQRSSKTQHVTISYDKEDVYVLSNASRRCQLQFNAWSNLTIFTVKKSAPPVHAIPRRDS